MTTPTPVALDALGIPPRSRPSTYPQSIQALLGERLAGREKRALGDAYRQVADLKVKELLERRHARLDGYGRFTDTKADAKTYAAVRWSGWLS